MKALVIIVLSFCLAGCVYHPDRGWLYEYDYPTYTYEEPYYSPSYTYRSFYREPYYGPSFYYAPYYRPYYYYGSYPYYSPFYVYPSFNFHYQHFDRYRGYGRRHR